MNIEKQSEWETIEIDLNSRYVEEHDELELAWCGIFCSGGEVA